MNVTREVILDLLPLYLADEASPATRVLVEEYLAGDPELARRVRAEWKAELAGGAAGMLPPEIELQSLRRTRRLLALQKWLFGAAIGFTAISATSVISFENNHLTDFHLLIRDHPLPLGICAVLATACWISYSRLRHRLRSTAF
jgi:hypothetical protein